MEYADIDDLPVTGASLATESCAPSDDGAAELQEADQDLLRCLKGLGVRADQARMAVEHSRESGASAIEHRLHVALKFIGSRGRTYGLQQAAMSRAG